ncbi:MAG: cytochrome-c oxidase, cbb3-type subunit III [Gammaproteobacteria bacterium]|jgi:cytochrome c oxidase cbb3-type subunit 3
MADFTSSFWSYFIAISSLAGIVGLIILLIKCSTRKKSGSGSDKVETMGHVWDENLEEYNNPLPAWWLYMFVLTIVWGVGYLIMYPGLGAFSGVLGWSQVNQLEAEMQSADETYGPIYKKYQDTDLVALSKDETALKIGERLYASYCTTCHGSDARGARGYPNLRDDDWLFGGEPENIKTSIMKGRNALMPAWEAVLSESDIFNVTSYVEQLSGRIVDSLHASKGKQIYNINCAACHGPEGKGNPIMGAPNLSDDIWLYGGSQKKIIESIIRGRNGIMPAHGEFLGEAKVHILSAYIYSLSNKE